MKLSKEKPPNIDEILKVFPSIFSDLDRTPIFCYGDTIYNAPDDLRRDLIYHEEVHSKQQGSNPTLWWTKYLHDKEFRLEQEIEAYGNQYALIKKILPSKFHKQALYEMASSLSSDVYGRIIGHGEAESKIRNYAKNLNGKTN
jgi:hypothetical protein